MAHPPLSRELAEHAVAAVDKHQNVTLAARAIGISRSSLTTRLEVARTRYGLAPKHTRAAPVEPFPPPPSPEYEPPAMPVSALREPLTSFEEAWAQWQRCIGMARDRYVPKPGTIVPESGTRKILVVPDLHAPFHEPEMLAAILERESDADHCICIGDVGDSYALSRFIKYERVPFADEWASVTLVVQELANRFPRVTLIVGNHDARLEKQIRTHLTEDMVDAIRYMAGGTLCPLTALAKRYPNVEIAKHVTPSGHTLDWCMEVGDAWLGHPEKYSRVAGSALRAVEDWLLDFQQQFGFENHRLVVMGHTHTYAQIPFRGDKLLVECGCLCRTQGYMTTARIGGRPQRRGYLTFEQTNGRTDLNSVRWFGFD